MTLLFHSADISHTAKYANYYFQYVIIKKKYCPEIGIFIPDYGVVFIVK